MTEDAKNDQPTFELPFLKAGGRFYLSQEQVSRDPSLAETIAKHPDRFEFDGDRCLYWFVEETMQ